MAKSIRVLLYVTPRFKWKYKINWLISLWTRSKYSHCSLWEADSRGRFSRAGIKFCKPITYICGTCYTSTMRDKANGTVSRPASGVLDKPSHWEYIEIEVAGYRLDWMIEWMGNQVDANKGYALWDLFKFLSPIHLSDNKRNICSEFVNNALCQARVLKKHGIISPKQLHKRLTKLGYKTLSLAGPTQTDIDNIIKEVNDEPHPPQG